MIDLIRGNQAISSQEGKLKGIAGSHRRSFSYAQLECFRLDKYWEGRVPRVVFGYIREGRGEWGGGGGSCSQVHVEYSGWFWDKRGSIAISCLVGGEGSVVVDGTRERW